MRSLGEYVPDLVVEEQLIVDTKTIERITDHERGQMLNYLRITGLPGGAILNFKHARLEWERLVLTKEPRRDANKRQLEAERRTFSLPANDSEAAFLDPLPLASISVY